MEKYKKYKKIIVSGPQRSGTRICAKIIANELNYKYVDEQDFGITRFNKFLEKLKEDNVVIQCPALSDRLLDVPDDVLIIFMKRNVKDIINSQNRIGWYVKGKPLYSSGVRERFMYRNFKEYDETIPISQLKYNVWEWQKQFIKNYDEIEYESLKEYNLWIDKNKRKNNEWNQTR